MKRLFLFVIMMFSFSNAQNLQCELYETFARDAMTLRQLGISNYEVHKYLEFTDIERGIVTIAYDNPVYDEPIDKLQAIVSFGEMTSEICQERELELILKNLEKE